MSKFKVGDAVEFTDKTPTIYWFGPHTDKKGGVISAINHDWSSDVTYDVDVPGNDWPASSVDASLIRHAKPYTSCAAAEVDNLADEYGRGKPSLKIEAGKFYKTRDGRKVGPMVLQKDSFVWFDTEPKSGHGWYDCGHVYKGGPSDERDAIAEWTDAPTTIADIVARHSQTGTAIVAVLENGQPRPATRPYVHTTASAAETEANRLARTNPGKEFGVYTLGSVAKVEKTYDHEWQRLAVGGKTYEAKTALTNVAGIEFYQAAKIVNDWREDLMRAA